MAEMIQFCRDNPGSRTCIFPFVEDGRICQLGVLNPFYSVEAGVKATEEARERLKDAPSRLEAMLARLQAMRRGEL